MINHTNTTTQISAKYWVLIAFSILCIIALSLTIVMLPQNTSKKSNENITNLTSQPMIGVDGWNQNILGDLQDASTRYGDNVALGTANGVHGVVVSLGGYKWQVVYRQNDVLTLYCLDEVVVSGFSNGDVDYSSSDINQYLNGQFLNDLLNNVGYDQFADCIISTGDNRISYQLYGMQNINLFTLDNQQIINNDIVSGQKIWLPSAYEVGGYLLGENGSIARVNSFNADSINNQTISSGLWNLSNEYRQGDKVALRSSTTDGKIIYVSNNGSLCAGAPTDQYVVRPALNIVVPNSGDVNNIMSNASKLAITGSGTQASPYVISTARDVITFSNNVLNGDSYSGKYIELANDIDLSGVTIWTPIGLYNNGTESKPFSGIFDGKGHRLSHISSANTGLVGLFGYASGATIKNVAVVNTNWSTAGNYAGGLVSVIDNGTSISTCYNESSVSGSNYVGGIVGAINLTSNVACSITDVYNVGAVAGASNVAGIVGNASASVVSRVYSSAINSGVVGSGDNITVNNAYYIGNNTQTFGTSCASWAVMRMQSTYTGFGFYSSSNTSGVWFKSAYVNNGFPTLKVFVTNVDVKLYTNLSAGGDYYVKIAGDNTEYKSVSAPLGSSATFTIETNSGYRFAGWYSVVLATSGNPVINSSEAVLVNNALTFVQTLDDYVYLEARFVKTFTVNIDTLFSDFSTSYANANAVSVSYDGTKIGNDYDIGSVITFTVNTGIDELGYKGIGYKTSSASSTYTPIGVDENNVHGYWTNVLRSGDVLTYILTVGDSDAFVTDVFDIQIQFERQFNLTLVLDAEGNENLPSISVQFGVGGNTLTVSDGVSRSAVFEYAVPGGLRLGVDMTNATLGGVEVRELEGWTFEYGTYSQNIANTATAILLTSYIPTNNSTYDSMYELTLTATFTMNDFTITASSVLSSSQNANDPRESALSSLYVKLGSGASVQSIDSDVLTVGAPYNSIVSVCFVPNHAFGYKLDSLVVDGNTVTPIINDYGVYYYNWTMPTHNVTVTLNIQYIPITINNAVAVKNGNNYTPLSQDVTLSPQSYTAVTYYNNIASTSLSLSTTNNFHMCYALKSVDVSFDNGTNYTTILTYNNSVAQSSYTLFDNGTLVKFLYQQANNTALTLNNNVLNLRVVLEAVNTTLTVVACYEGSSNVVESQYTSISLSNSNQISANTTTQVYSYVLGTEVTITAGAVDQGHRVVGFSTQASASSGFEGTVGAGFGNEAVHSRVLNANTTIYVYYSLRVFNISFVSNANTLANGNATLSAQGVSAQDGFDNSNIALNFDTSSTTTSTISMIYGHSLVFSVTEQISVNYKDLKLVNLIVEDTDTNAVLSGYSVVATPQTIQLVADESGNVHANIQITLTFNFLQTVYLKIGNGVSASDRSILNGATLMFINQDTTDTTPFKLTSGVLETAANDAEGFAMTLLADGNGTTYTVTIFFDISHSMNSTTVILTDSNSNAGTEFEITLSEGRSATITIDSIVSHNAAVNISGYFVFG